MITLDTPTAQGQPDWENGQKTVKGGTTEMILGRLERYFNKEDSKGDQSDEHAI